MPRESVSGAGPAARPERSAFVALGSNLGDRRVNLERAIDALRRLPECALVRVSSFIETPAERVPGERAGDPGPDPGGAYLNAVAEVRTTLHARALLEALHAIESSLGRDRAAQAHGAPRTIDLDVLLVGDEIHAEPGLRVPHPRMHERRFVLEPLNEIAPELVIPRVGATPAGLLARLRSVVVMVCAMLLSIAAASSGYAQVAPPVTVSGETVLDEAARFYRAAPWAERVSIVIRTPRPPPLEDRPEIHRGSLVVRLDPGARDGARTTRAPALALELGPLRAYASAGELTVITTTNPSAFWREEYARFAEGDRPVLPSPARLAELIPPVPLPQLALVHAGASAPLLPWLSAPRSATPIVWEPVSLRPDELGGGPIALRGRSEHGPIAIELASAGRSGAPAGGTSVSGLRLRRLSATLPSTRGPAVPESQRPRLELTFDPVEPGESSAWVIDVAGWERVPVLSRLRDLGTSMIGQKFPVGSLRSTGDSANESVRLEAFFESAEADASGRNTHLALVLLRPGLALEGEPSPAGALGIAQGAAGRMHEVCPPGPPPEGGGPAVPSVRAKSVVVLADGANPPPVAADGPPREWTHWAPAPPLARLAPGEPVCLVVVDPELRIRAVIPVHADMAVEEMLELLAAALCAK